MHFLFWFVMVYSVRAKSGSHQKISLTFFIIMTILTYLHTILKIILLMKHYWMSWKYLLLLFGSFKQDFKGFTVVVSDN